MPSVAAAQSLRCPEDQSVPRIRSVAFEGNASFTDNELALHVVSTETDLFRRLFNRKAIPVGAAAGAIAGAALRREDGWFDETTLTGAIAGGAIGASVGWLLSNSSGEERCYRPGLLVGDITNIRGFYGDRGFPDTRVDTVTTREAEWIDILFRITEGEPVLIDSVNISLDSSLADLRPKLNSRTGERYSPLLIQQDVDSIETRLRNSGYPAAVALRTVSYTSAHRATVALNIDRGPFARIGKIRILPAGIENRPTVVDTAVIRDLLLFDEGDVYSERILFDSERRFYRVGAFLSTEVSPDVSHLYQDSLVDVNVRVVEDLTHQFSAEPGLGTLDCLRGRAEYTDRAFRGGLNRVDVSASISKVGRASKWPVIDDICSWQQDDEPDISSREINYNGTVRYTRPTPLRGGLLPSLSAYTERRGGYQAYLRTTIIGGALTVSKNITRTIFWDASYTMEYGKTEANESVLCFVFRACDDQARNQLTRGNTRLAVLGTRFSRDRRNFVDSASAGGFARLDLRASDKWILSDTSLIFQKAVADAGWYTRPFGSSVLALRLRAGVVRGGQQSVAGRLPPPQERLYTGGETSVRGFRQNELGPLIYVTESTLEPSRVTEIQGLPAAQRDSVIQNHLRLRTIPTGGNAMAVGNLELRLPGPFLKTLQTIFFVDVGALSTEGIATIGEKQARWTPGIAIKYFSLIGPIQFNLGYNSYVEPDGPVYLNQGPTTGRLTCLSGTNAEGVCQPTTAKLARRGLRKLIFTIALPPDF